MKPSFMQLLLRYLVFIGIPYFIARRIEKYVTPRLEKKLNKKLKDLPELDTVSENTKDSLDTRGGDLIVLWVTKVILTDLPIKAAIAGGLGASIWSETADNTAGLLAKYGSAMLAAPGKKFVRLYRTIKGVDPHYPRDIKEILYDKTLSNDEKLVILKIKIESTLKNLKGSKRKQFILFVIATILFSVGGNFVLFAWFMERLRALIGTTDDVNIVQDYVIEAYREFNAPLPRELVENLPDEIIQSITNID